MVSILLVDDDVSTLGILEGFLEDHGYAVTTARNGIDALKILNTRSFDLMITDILMPDVDGYEVIANAKIKRNCPHIIAISGGGSGADKEKLLATAGKLGAVKTFLKPIDVVELVNYIKYELELKLPAV